MMLDINIRAKSSDNVDLSISVTGLTAQQAYTIQKFVCNTAFPLSKPLSEAARAVAKLALEQASAESLSDVSFIELIKARRMITEEGVSAAKQFITDNFPEHLPGWKR